LKSMSDYKRVEDLQRNKTLIIVEGDLEKNIILKTILLCFREIPVRFEDIHIFKSDIYDLYNDIDKEYGEDWFEEELSIDLPFLISRRLQIEPHLDKRNYTNIILMFDYERHDLWYSDEKIIKLQKHFNNTSEDGLLYINYPMIESLFHFDNIPDLIFYSKKIPVECKPGKKYKNLVKKESKIQQYIMLYDKMKKSLKKYISADEHKTQLYAEELLSLTSVEEIEPVVKKIASESILLKGDSYNLKCVLEANMKRYPFINKSISYWDDLRNILLYIVKENIKKAYMIQDVDEKSDSLTIREQYENLDWDAVLERQNKNCADSETGFIYVLCTCITFLGEYKFCWK